MPPIYGQDGKIDESHTQEYEQWLVDHAPKTSLTCKKVAAVKNEDGSYTISVST